MNVYVAEVARRLAEAGVETEIFTRATSSDLPQTVEMAPGVLVRHVIAGPFEGLAKEDLPAQLCAFTTGVLRAEAAHAPGYYDLVHSHYWLSGQVGWLARERWGVPLVHSAHTLAKVKNAQLAAGDRPEPLARVVGEEQVVAEADRLVANTPSEARDLIDRYGADPDQVSVVEPGVDLDRFTPPRRPAPAAPAAGWACPSAATSSPSSAGSSRSRRPTCCCAAAAALHARDPEIARDLTVVIVGGPSGTGLDRPTALIELAAVAGHQPTPSASCRRRPAATSPTLYRAADLVAVPSYNESFGLVALEAQACGTPVVAAAVGGLVTAVRDEISGVLVDGHDPDDWARALGGLLAAPGRRAVLSRGAVAHASEFSWSRTASGLLAVYGGR